MLGFGGANAHAILEAYTPPEGASCEPDLADALSLTPFVFSASSESALQRTLSTFRDYLTDHPDTNPFDLAWTLRARRSALPIKIAISASSIGELASIIDEKLGTIEKTPSTTIGVRSTTGQARILGVFTGQGAQWARMGKQLIDTLPQAKKLAAELDETLQKLPESNRPSWSLVEELSRDAKSSRLQEAAFS